MQWPAKILAAKYFAVTNAWSITDTALDLTGGRGHFAVAGWSSCSGTPAWAASTPGTPLSAHGVVGEPVHSGRLKQMSRTSLQVGLPVLSLRRQAAWGRSWSWLDEQELSTR